MAPSISLKPTLASIYKMSKSHFFIDLDENLIDILNTRVARGAVLTFVTPRGLANGTNT